MNEAGLKQALCSLLRHDWEVGWDELSGWRECSRCGKHEDFLPYSGYVGTTEPMRSYMAGEITSAEYFQRIREAREAAR